ncbi:MAG TPA: glycosyltransferase family 39 protein, partial [Chloroflexota bacterium]
WPLFVVLLLQAGLSLSLLARPVVLDEATYIDAGRAEVAHWLHGTRMVPYEKIFSGAPVIYPPLSNAAASVGGLFATRLLSLCLMLGATALLYATARLLLSARAAILAAALFATTSSALYVGVLATYDALALTLLAAAAWFAVRSAEADGRRRLYLLAAMCVLLVAANATKYASALWDPVVIAMAMLADARRRSWGKALVTAIASAVGTLVLLAIAALVAGPSYVDGLLFSTVARTANNGTPALTILESAGRWIGLVAVLAVVGAIALTRTPGDRPLKIMAWILAAAVFLAPAEQARIGVAVSLFKHVGFGAWFAAIPAGYGISVALAALSGSRSDISARTKAISAVMAAVFAAAIAVGIYEAQETNSVPAPYPATVVADLKPILHGSSGPWLADTPNAIIYYTHTSPLRWRSTFGFAYTDPATHSRLHGIAAYVAAIRHGYFSDVILRANRKGKSIDQALLAILRHSQSYHLTIFHPGRGPAGRHASQDVLVWQRLPRGTG